MTESASLVVGLTFSHRGWDVASQTPDADTSPEGDVVVLDLGSTLLGVEEAARLAPHIRVIVIGDEEPAGAPPPGVRLLVRPFTLEELIAYIEQLLSPATDGPLTSPGPETAVHDAPEAAAQDDGPVRTEETGVEVPQRPEEHRDLASDQQQVGPVEQRRSLSSRLFGRIAETPEVEGDEVAAPPAPDDTTHVVPLSEAEPASLNNTTGDTGTPVATTTPPRPPPAPSTSTNPEATTILERRVVHNAPAAPVAEPPAVRPTRWRARRQKTGSAAERQLRERLARVLAATSELERLTEELPLLADLSALATAVVREVAGQFDADTVGLWRPAGSGWRAVAHQGLTWHEASWIVPFDQPLFAEVHATGGALLLDPVDAVQAAVVGIGGAHTESFMAASIAAGPGRYGILAVGRDRQLVERDLDALGELALEMAPGMAVAEQVERIQRTAPPVPADEAARPERRAWREPQA